MKKAATVATKAAREGKGGTSKQRHAQLTEEALELIAARFRVLAEPMRLKILNALGDDEMSVTELVDATAAGQANVSKHLAMLAGARLVARRKEGLNVYYRVADETVFDLCDAVCSSLGERLAAQHDAVRHFSGSHTAAT
jgi:DNA-binding transcriptional ArsR family regulator